MVAVGHDGHKETVIEYLDTELVQAENAILEAVEEETAFSPRSLVEHVKQRHEHISEEAINLAFWDLLGRAEIELTRDRQREHIRATSAV
jgi:hypothetical protein